MSNGEQIVQLLKIIKESAPPNAKAVTALGMTMTITQWAAYSGICRASIAQRLVRGYNAEKAVTQSATPGNNQFLIY